MISEEERKLSSLFGRDEILTRLEQRLKGLKKGYRQNVGLLGPRFIGKTSLLTHFLETVRRDPEVISIYVSFEEADLEAFSERWLGGLLQGVLASKQIPFPEEFQPLVKIARTFIPKTLERMKEARKHAFGKKWNTAFRELLGLTDALQQETGKKILLILDEFQDLAGLELADPFGLFGKEMMIQKNTFYLAASSEPKKSLEIFQHRLSLLFGNFEILNVGPLEQKAIRQMAAEKCREARVPETELRILSHLLDNHPYYFNLFFEAAERRFQQEGSPAWNRESSLGILENLLFSKTGAYNLFFESRLRELIRFGRVTRPYVRTLVALALGRGKPAGIAAFIGRKVSEVQKMLFRLAEEGMIEKQGSIYCLPDPLFRVWLRKVYYLRERNLEPDGRRVTQLFRVRLRQELERIEEEDRMDLTERVSALFREFRNEIVSAGALKIKCPAFLEMAARPTNGRYFPISARTREGRWFCQVTRETLTEADVFQFAEEIKQSRQKVKRRLLVALGGIELNARLLAQEAKVQIWELENFNALLNLFGKLKVIVS